MCSVELKLQRKAVLQLSFLIIVTSVHIETCKLSRTVVIFHTVNTLFSILLD